MKASKEQIYFEQQISGETVSPHLADLHTWQVWVQVNHWRCEGDSIYEMLLGSIDRRKKGRYVERRCDRQLLGCDTDAAAIRATQRLCDERVRALAGTIIPVVEVEVTP
ncbi:MAG TPA: hypothetical protein VM537_08610 [Anaerolineae bacterium]|nr:hypothetical protein [Anaerolineae bacterium]